MGENAAKKKDSGFNIFIPTETIRGVELMKAGDYRYARLSANLSDDVYVSVSYEWKGSIPDEVMSLMEFMKANKNDVKEDAKVCSELSKRITAV